MPPKRSPAVAVADTGCSARTKNRSATRCEQKPKCITWNSSFVGDAGVRIGRQGDEITLRWGLSPVQATRRRHAPPVVALAPADWARLQDALIAASFWALDPDGVDWPIDGDEQRTIAADIASRGLGGSDCVIEGRRKDIFGAMSRWSLRGVVRDLGALFFELAGTPLAEVGIY
jgi:hypothetical protein